MAKFQLPESIRKDREAALLTNNNEEIKPRPRPPPTICFIPSTSIDTSAPTCATEAEDTMYNLYLATSSSWVIHIINPATGKADDVFKASMMKRYRQDIGIADEVLGGSLLKRPRDDLGESSKTLFTAFDEMLGGSVLNPHYKGLESIKTVVAEISSGNTHY